MTSMASVGVRPAASPDGMRVAYVQTRSARRRRLRLQHLGRAHRRHCTARKVHRYDARRYVAKCRPARPGIAFISTRSGKPQSGIISLSGGELVASRERSWRRRVRVVARWRWIAYTRKLDNERITIKDKPKRIQGATKKTNRRGQH